MLVGMEKGRRKAVTKVTLSVTGQNSSGEHCKKGDVQMTDDQAKNERL